MLGTRVWLPQHKHPTLPSPHVPRRKSESARGIKGGQRGPWPTRQSLSPLGEEPLHPPRLQEEGTSPRVAGPHSSPAPGASAWVPSKARSVWPSVGCDSRGPSTAPRGQLPTGLIRHLCVSDQELPQGEQVSLRSVPSTWHSAVAGKCLPKGHVNE